MRQHRKTSQHSDRKLLTGLLILELDDLHWSRGLEKLLGDWQPAGVLLGERYVRSPEGTAELLGKIGRVIDRPPILALRESGSRLGALRDFQLQIPSPRAVGRQGPKAARKLGELIGAVLKIIGFNTTFGPSLDLSAPYSDFLLGDRLFSSDPEEVAYCGGAFIHGLRRHGILAAPGHFPGISDTRTDQVTKQQVADKSMAEMWHEDLVPFRKLLDEVPFVLASHLAYKAYDLDSVRPASCSNNVLQGLLRDKLRFRGAVISDFPGMMSMESEASRVSASGFALSLDLKVYGDSLAAGCDLQTIWANEMPMRMTLQALEHSLKLGTLSRTRLEGASARVQRAKKGLRRPTGRLNRKAFDKLARDFEDFAKTCKE